MYLTGSSLMIMLASSINVEWLELTESMTMTPSPVHCTGKNTVEVSIATTKQSVEIQSVYVWDGESVI